MQFRFVTALKRRPQGLTLYVPCIVTNYVVGSESFRPDQLYKVTEIKQICYFFNIVSLYFNTLFNWYINLTIDGTIYPSQHFPFGAAYVCQPGNFWTLLRTFFYMAQALVVWRLLTTDARILFRASPSGNCQEKVAKWDRLPYESSGFSCQYLSKNISQPFSLSLLLQLRCTFLTIDWDVKETLNRLKIGLLWSVYTDLYSAVRRCRILSYTLTPLTPSFNLLGRRRQISTLYDIYSMIKWLHTSD